MIPVKIKWKIVEKGRLREGSVDGEVVWTLKRRTHSTTAMRWSIQQGGSTVGYARNEKEAKLKAWGWHNDGEVEQ